jgi:hypothetical protein
MTKPADQRPVVSKAERIGSAVIGVLFVAIALWLGVITRPQPSTGEVIVVLVVGILGIEALSSAIQRRRSFLSRIGPLP